jgi:hypothetical protein
LDAGFFGFSAGLFGIWPPGSRLSRVEVAFSHESAHLRQFNQKATGVAFW